MKKIDAVKHFGSQTNIAKAIGISRDAVSKWSDIIPEGNAAILHHITNGKLKYDRNAYLKQAS